MNLQRRVQELFQQYQGAIVRLESMHIEPGESDTDQPRVRVKDGTGFFISREGLILAGASRVKGSRRVTVYHQGSQYLAEVIATDEQTNVALLKALYLPDSFDFLRMNESPALPDPGTFGLTITCPLKLSPTPRMTMIAGHETKFDTKLFPTTFIRLDTPSFQGEVGGPIIDLQGRLIGMLFAGVPQIQSSYALPAGAINKIKDDLLLEGRASYASVGIEIGQDFIRGNKTRVKILDVASGSPAAVAGIMTGDFVKKVGDYTISDFSDFPNAMFFIRVGEYVDMEIERDSKTIAFNLPTIRRPDEDRLVKIRPMTPEEVFEAMEEQQAELAPQTDISPEPETSEVEAPSKDETTPLSIPLSPEKETEGPTPQN
ncbi:MAG: S1C family serine protease [Opitutales bacterium]